MKVGALVAGKYRILRRLGEGGMGSVWLAKNEVTERDFAIKFLHQVADRPHTADQLNRFFQEAKVAGKLRHPSIVEIFDAGTEASLGDAPYLVMEVLDGMGLDEAIQRAHALPLGVSLEIMGEVSRGLALAHQKGIIHRDLKPSNVYLHRSGSGAVVAKVLDFGISKVLVDDAGKHITAMTRTGAVLGSPLYMSPEQAAGDRTIDARSDVHALGVMLWECLVGRPPFTADTYGLLLVEIIQGERPELSQVLPAVPPDVAAVVRRALARDRNQRFENAGAVATALEASLSALGHVPMLSTRDGAEQFFALVGEDTGATVQEGTTTTAALEVPSQIRGVEPTPAVAAQSEQREPAILPAAALEAAPLSRIPGTRSPLPAIAGVIALVLVAGGGVFVATRASSNGEPALAEPGASAPSVGLDPGAGLPTAPSGPREPDVAPVVSSETPAASVASTPVAPAPPPKQVGVATKVKPGTKPAETKPAETKLKPGTKPDPVHHGVTNSGL